MLHLAVTYLLSTLPLLALTPRYIRSQGCYEEVLHFFFLVACVSLRFRLSIREVWEAFESGKDLGLGMGKVLRRKEREGEAHRQALGSRDNLNKTDRGSLVLGTAHLCIPDKHQLLGEKWRATL